MASCKKEGDNLMNFLLPMVEVFYGHRCNLSCKGCTSASDIIKTINYDPSLDSILDSIDNLATYVDVKEFDLMGGEAFLYWESIEKISEHIRKKFPKSTIGICTNGLLLEKFQDKLIEFCKNFHPRVIDITNHFTLFSEDIIAKKYKIKLDNFLKNNKITKTKTVKWGVTQDNIEIYSSNTFDVRIADAQNFYSCYYITNENKIKPFATNDARGSYKYGCAMPNCHLLYESKLYKCSWFALLPKILEIKNQLDDPDWTKYLNYKALDLKNLNLDDLENFVATSNTHIDLCDMCSNNKTFSIKHSKENVF